MSTSQSLKKNSAFRAPLSDETASQPRALRTLASIVDGDLCHRCGTCVGICPTKVLGVDGQDYPQVENLSACTDCDLCVKVCPGEQFDAQKVAKEIFGELPDLKDMHGRFSEAHLSYACDETIREGSTSGGLVTGLLVGLLKEKAIDGAVVVGSDPGTPWRGKPQIARTPEEIMASAKSKYAIAPTNVVFQEILEKPGRYAFVGLPCQIHGLHKAAEISPLIRERVVLSIGLFCHAAVEHDPMEYIWSKIPGNQSGDVEKFISRVGKHPGTPYVKRKNVSKLEPVYFPEAKGYRPSSMEVLNVLYRLYTPPRCLTCYDSTAEFADIAVGDPWMKPPEGVDFLRGYSFTLSRTEAGDKALALARDKGHVNLKPLSRKEAEGSNTMMGEEKRWRAFRVLETRRRRGELVPEYGFRLPRASGKQFILTELNMFSHVFCFLKFGKETLLRLTFSKVGYYLLWLNSRKRSLREWARNKGLRD